MWCVYRLAVGTATDILVQFPVSFFSWLSDILRLSIASRRIASSLLVHFPVSLFSWLSDIFGFQLRPVGSLLVFAIIVLRHVEPALRRVTADAQEDPVCGGFR